jgi:septal ring factor EnvC (AmiA/AmiB activator)
MIPSLESKLALARQQHAVLQESLAEQKREQQRIQLELSQLQNKLENVTFLRTQLARAEDEVELRRRVAGGRHPSASDRRVRLELQQDGTVRAVPAAPTTTASSQ